MTHQNYWDVAHLGSKKGTDGVLVRSYHFAEEGGMSWDQEGAFEDHDNHQQTMRNGRISDHAEMEKCSLGHYYIDDASSLERDQAFPNLHHARVENLLAESLDAAVEIQDV